MSVLAFRQKFILRVSLSIAALVPTALAPSQLDAQQQTVSALTSTGQSVACVAGTVQLTAGRLGTCTLAQNTGFNNSYGVSPSGQGSAWTMHGIACMGGSAITFDNRGNVQSCTLTANRAVTNSYGASPSNWSFGFSCRGNATITFAPNGHIIACTSAMNQSVNTVLCPRNSLITVAGGGAVTCTGGGGAASATVTGAWRMNFVFNGGSYPYDLRLNQRGASLTGNGTYPAGAANPQYAWTVGPGSVRGDRITFTARYTLGTQATMQVTGSMLVRDGVISSMSGTWSDDYAGGRQGTWTAVRASNR